MSVATVANWAANFVVSYFFLPGRRIGRPGTFWCTPAWAWWRSCFSPRLPETKGRSLEEIQREVTGTTTA